MTLDNNEQRISESELEAYLWNAAVLLRGLIDAGDYKGYIFPLIFLKRISDVWDEEEEAAKKIYTEDINLANLPENHRFMIPDGCHWNDIRDVSLNVGTKIVNSMREIEATNQASLTGVFGDADWTNKNLLSDEVLSNLIEHFSTEKLTISRLPEDELGNAYEFLIKKFADDSGHTAQEFYTNRTLVHLMTSMLSPLPGESIYDPTCGTGGMLISSVTKLKNEGKEYRTLRLFGQEMNYTTASIAKMNLFLHGIEDGNIKHGDTLANPKFISKDGSLQTFNVVLANPPYSIKTLNRDAFASDQFGRNLWGVPPQGRADYAFLQHIAKSMDEENGRAAVLFPHGVLFRKEERDLRKALVNSGQLKAVIGLGAGLFYNSPMESVIVILNSKKKQEKNRRINFIDARKFVSKNRTTSYLSENDQNEILNAFISTSSIEGVSYLATIREIELNDWSLSLSLYLSKNESLEVGSIDSLKDKFRSLTNANTSAIVSLDELFSVVNASVENE